MPIIHIGIDVSPLKSGASRAKAALSGVSGAFDKASQASERASREIRGTSAAVNEAAGSVKKLAAQVVALVGAYKALDGLKEFVKRGVSFASSLEDAQTSIASIVSATNDIATTQGKSLDGAEKFAASLEISKNVMDEIQVLALESTATFDSLVQGVSGIIAPATKAGVAIEKLPKFAVTAAQAMQTMKIPLEQMRTEIESLLSGNINKVQDLLATNLGITSEMVRQWKEQGVLVQELEKRMEPFALAGQRVADSWSGLKSNMRDALDYLGKVSGEGLFESLKQSYRELLDLMVTKADGKPGISAEFENVAALMRDIQDAIGDGILDVTRALIAELKELNQPENIAEIKRAFSEFKTITVELLGAVKNVSGALVSFVGTALQGWSNMPDIIQEMGLVGAVLLGAKGRVALAAAGSLDNFVRGFAATIGGDMSFLEFAKLPGGEEGRRILDALEGKGAIKAPPLAAAHGKTSSQPNIDYVVTAAIADSTESAVKKSGGGASQVENARQSLARLREEIDQLNGTASKEGGALNKKLAEIDKLGNSAKISAAEIRQLKDDYAAAFKEDTLRQFDQEVLRLEGNTAALREMDIAQTLTEWGLRFADLGMSAQEAAPHLERLKTALQMQDSYKDLQTVAEFYKELADLSGEYGQSIDYQNQLIEKQAELWKQAGIPLEDIERRLKMMKQEHSGDMFDGFVRGLRKFGAEYGDMAAQVEDFTFKVGQTISNTLADAFMKGKFSAYDFFNSLISYAAQAASNAFVGKIFGGLGDFFGGLFDGGETTVPGTNYTPGEAVMAGVAHTGWSSVGKSAPGNGVRVLPASTFFGAPRFHSGGGLGANEYAAVLMRGERVLNPEETRAYNAGQRSMMNGLPSLESMFRDLPSSQVYADYARISGELLRDFAASRRANATTMPEITVNVINQTGQNVEAQTQTRQDANGGLNLDIIIQQVDSALAARAKSGKSAFGQYMQKTYGLDKATTIMRGRGR